VFRNEGGNSASWLGLRFLNPPPHRQPPGVRVEAERADGFEIWRRSGTDGSYASAGEPRVLLGLQDADGPVRLRVEWPGGRIQEYASLPPNLYITLLDEGDRK
jgi:hypothetical protein